MKFSRFAKRFSPESAIVDLMADLGDAMAGEQNMLMLGGGNPSHIPEVVQFFHDSMHRILANPSLFASIIGNYDPPQGEQNFRLAVIELINEQYGWDLTEKNIVLTSGSQAAFFYPV